MIINFNPSGTQVRKGFLLVRLDFTPDIGEVTYDAQHVYVPIEPYSGKTSIDEPFDLAHYRAWKAGVAHIWRTNPCLSHFIIVPETISKLDISGFMERVFKPGTVATLDNALSLKDAYRYAAPFLADKGILERKPVVTHDIADLIGSVNARLLDFSLGASSDSDIQPIQPRTITLGIPAADMGSRLNGGNTYISLHGAASGTGSLTYFETWFDTDYGDGDGVKVGTFYGTAPNFTSRDVHAWGTVTGGSKQTVSVGVDVDVQANDVIGTYFTVNLGRMEKESSGYSDIYYLAGDQFGAGQQNYTNSLADDGLSLYATGTEAGGANILRQMIEHHGG